MSQKFKIGDEVRFINKRHRFWKVGETHIIKEVLWDGECFEYTTNRGAWFGEADFELVSECSKRTLKILTRDIG